MPELFQSYAAVLCTAPTYLEAQYSSFYIQLHVSQGVNPTRTVDPALWNSDEIPQESKRGSNLVTAISRTAFTRSAIGDVADEGVNGKALRASLQRDRDGGFKPDGQTLDREGF